MPPAIIQSLLRKTPTLAPITNRALLSISGSDSNVFLNGILSTTVRPPQASAFLHAQGRVLYDVLIYKDPNPGQTKGPAYIIEYSPPPPGSTDVPPLFNYLKRHVLRSKVKVRDITGQYDIWASWGAEIDKKWETTREWSRAQSGAVEPVWEQEAPWGMEDGVIQDRRAVGMGRRLLTPQGVRPLEASDHDIATSDDYLLHRVLHGVPEGNVDIPPMQAFPMDSNLDLMGAVDFRKGCYVGQELTVRTYHKGVVRKRIHPIILSQQSDPTMPATLTSTLPSDLDIKPVQRAASDTEKRGPRPRGTGKLLSTTRHGVGLALLRLEHVTSAQTGAITLEVAEEGKPSLSVTPWVPSWWPQALEDDTQ